MTLKTSRPRGAPANFTLKLLSRRMLARRTSRLSHFRLDGRHAARHASAALFALRGKQASRRSAPWHVKAAHNLAWIR
jgi:hypothetical protein